MIPWEEIKNHWRDEFNQTEIYSDENEHIVVFRSKGTFIILGYLHFNSSRVLGVPTLDFIAFTDFIAFIKKLAENSYDSYKIYLMCNRHISEIKNPEKILSLPNYIDYYTVDYNWFYKTIEFKQLDLAQSAKFSESLIRREKPWFHNKGIPVITDSRFEDWDKWAQKKYNREWYESNEIEKFDANWDIDSIISLSEIYIDDRFVFGFFVVWKYDSFE